MTNATATAGPEPADKELEELLEVLRHVWERRWLAVAVAWGVGLLAAVALLAIHDRYESRARLYVDTQTILQPLLQGLTVQPDIDQMYAMLARTLINRPNIERIMEKAGLDKEAATPQARDQMIEKLTKDISVKPAGGKNLFDITYRDTDAVRGLRVVQELVALFLSSSEGYKRRDTEEARKFIDEQIAIYETKLEDAENRLKDFKLRNVNVAAAAGGAAGQDHFARIDNVQQELSRVRVEARAAEEGRDALRRQLADPDSTGGPNTTVTAPAAMPETPVDARLDAQRKQLDELRQRYTDEHPDIIAARRTIAQLETERAREIEEMRRLPPEARASAASLSYQQIKVKLAEAEANVASLQGRMRELNASLQELRAQASRDPQVEAELAHLNRDYDVIKKNYEQLVQRRESASISGNVDQTNRLAEINVIEPPRVEDKPVFPSRKALVPVTLLLAIVAGIGAGMVANYLRPTVRSARELRRLSARPLLGMVSMKVEPSSIRRQRKDLLLFWVASAALVVFYAAWSAALALGSS
jgi:polysaccharide chain length determinant protein (PEP-CTERM system associated)